MICLAGIYALQNNIDRLQKDHEHASAIAGALQKKEFVEETLPVETNIIIFTLRYPYTAKSFVEKLNEFSILGYAISPIRVRLVTHLDITPEMVNKTIDIIQKL